MFPDNLSVSIYSSAMYEIVLQLIKVEYLIIEINGLVMRYCYKCGCTHFEKNNIKVVDEFLGY